MVDSLHLFHLHYPGIRRLWGLLQNLPQVVLSAMQHLQDAPVYTLYIAPDWIIILKVLAVLHCSGLGCASLSCPTRPPSPRHSQGADTDGSGNWGRQQQMCKQNIITNTVVDGWSQAMMITFLPITNFLNFLSDLVSPERDEKHDTFADLTLKQHRSDFTDSSTKTNQVLKHVFC